MTGGYRLPFLFLFLALTTTLAVSCGGDDVPSDTGPAGPVYSFSLDSQVIVGNGNADNVSAIAFAPDGRMFYAQQFAGDNGDTGIIRVVLADGSLQQAPFTTISVANYLGLDWGLTGLALDPDFATNHYVYAFYTAVAGDKIGKPTLVRFTDSNGTATEETVISADFPPSYPGHEGYNLNGDIHFGPDGFLYLSIGDYDQGTADPAKGGHPEVVSDLSTPIGKMLRVNKADGSAAPDNPFVNQASADPRVFAYGFREPFPFTFDATGANIYGTDNTTDTCEEINIITAGQSYGWPGGWVFPFADCTVGPGAAADLQLRPRRTPARRLRRLRREPGHLVPHRKHLLRAEGLAAGLREPEVGSWRCSEPRLARAHGAERAGQDRLQPAGRQRLQGRCDRAQRRRVLRE